jgi:hypothetical protein
MRCRVSPGGLGVFTISTNEMTSPQQIVRNQTRNSGATGFVRPQITGITNAVTEPDTQRLQTRKHSDASGRLSHV